MGKKRISYRARDRLRQYDEFNEPSFMPTISVERPIIIDQAVAKAYQQAMHKELGLGLRTQQKRHFHVVKPEDLTLKLVESVAVPKNQARQVAEQLGANLFNLLERTPTFMKLTLGKVACFSEAQPRKQFFNASVIGVEPQGWGGLKANYAQYDERTLRAPMSLLADESRACKQLLGSVVNTPYAVLLANSAKIPSRQFEVVEQAAYNSLPDEFEWQDPIIYLRTGRDISAVEVFPVRAPNVYDQVA